MRLMNLLPRCMLGGLPIHLGCFSALFSHQNQLIVCNTNMLVKRNSMDAWMKLVDNGCLQFGTLIWFFHLFHLFFILQAIWTRTINLPCLVVAWPVDCSSVLHITLCLKSVCAPNQSFLSPRVCVVPTAGWSAVDFTCLLTVCTSAWVSKTLQCCGVKISMICFSL